MTSTVLVTGGTGTLGRLVVPLLRDAGRTVRVLSRHQPPGAGTGGEHWTADLSTGSGVAAAVAGVETVVHCAGSAKGDGDKARHLVQAARAAGVRHLVYISVVGADRVPVVSGMDRAMFGYYAAKRAGEETIEASGLPWTTLRATQFHDLVLIMAQQLAKLPVSPVPDLQCQPVDARDVADRLVELALGRPSGLVAEIGGPRTYRMRELVASYLQAAGRRRLLVSVRPPGRAGRALRDGANLTPDHAAGRRTWEEFLAERVGAAAADRPRVLRAARDR